MRIVRFVAAILFLLLMLSPISAITNGDLDEDGHPCVGAILVDLDDDLFPPAEGWPDYWLLCSGTLIDWDDRDDVFLTAAHCTAALDAYIAWGYCTADDIYVCFEENCYDDPTTYIPVAEYYTHPDYTGKRPLRYDVGVCVLNTDGQDMPTPATLADEGYLDDLKDDGELRGGHKKVKFTVVGFGMDLSFPPPRRVPIDGDRRVAESGFLSVHKLHLYLLQNQAAGESGTGNGDSGGPAFWKDGDDEILVAVTSWGDPNLVATGIYQRADTEATQGFLSDVLD